MALYVFIRFYMNRSVCAENISKVTKDFSEDFDDNSDIGDIFEVELKYLEKLNLPFHKKC